MEFTLYLSNGQTTSHNNDDIISIVGTRESMTPRIKKGKNVNSKYYQVVNFNIDTLKITYKKFFESKDYDAEKKANEYLKTFDSYDVNNIQKYVINISISKIYENLAFFKQHFRYYINPLNYNIQEVPICPLKISLLFCNISKILCYKKQGFRILINLYYSKNAITSLYLTTLQV